MAHYGRTRMRSRTVCETSGSIAMHGWRWSCRTGRKWRWRSSRSPTAAVCAAQPGLHRRRMAALFLRLADSGVADARGCGSACRNIAHHLGIPLLDLPLAPGGGLAASHPPGRLPHRLAAKDFASGADDAFILLTSGTTSRPKMVPLTHRAHASRPITRARSWGFSLGPLAHVLPLFHAHGLISGLLAGLACGSSVICTPSFEPESFFEWLTELRPTGTRRFRPFIAPIVVGGGSAEAEAQALPRRAASLRLRARSLPTCSMGSNPCSASW